MKKIILISFCILALAALTLGAKEPSVLLEPNGTYKFAQKDTCSLYMDVYNPASGSETTYQGKQKPTVLFVFGGGFVDGHRDAKNYNPWFKMLTDDGYRVISIDYRLGFKPYQHTKGIAFAKAMDRAIHMAVQDLFSATKYIIDNSSSLGVDPSCLVISGSSAGAITVLQADYELCNGTEEAKVLPEGYKYAGVMSFSGAIFSHKGKVKYADTPAPTLMLHGTADKVVNYNKIGFLNIGFYGSNAIAAQFSKFGYNYNILRFVGHGHDIASMMAQTFDYQKIFLEKNVIMGNKRVVDSSINDPEIPVWKGSKNRKELYKN